MELLLAFFVVIPAYIILTYNLIRSQEREQEFYKLKETFLEKYNQKMLELLKENYQLANKTPNKQQPNGIETKEQIDIELNEDNRIPIMDGMKVKYDDEEEVVPISIS